MQIVCPNCKTSYQVEPTSVGPTGRSVRCARCQTVWFAANTAALSEIAASHRAEMAQFASTADGLEAWPQPDEAAHGFGSMAASDAADVGYVDDAPPIAAADSAMSEAAAAGYDVPAGPLLESPALAPIDEPPAAPAAALPEDIETVAARRAKEQARNRRFGWWPLPGLATAVLGLVLLDVGLIGWRTEVVRAVPQTASLYAAIGLAVNLRGLDLADVTTETLINEGVQVLMVQGRIVSVAKRVVDVPRLRFSVRNGSGNEIYSWTALPNRSLLGPGEALAFQSRLASPPPEAHDVQVRFFSRHDLGVGIQ
jgi:predicted Zn finger-like uncharacterized protein